MKTLMLNLKGIKQTFQDETSGIMPGAKDKGSLEIKVYIQN